MKRVCLSDGQTFNIAYEMARCLKRDLRTCKRIQESIQAFEQCQAKNMEEENLIKQKLEDERDFISRLQTDIDEYGKIIEKMGYGVERFLKEDEA